MSNSRTAATLKKAAHITAWCGLSTPVDTTVAMELAASLKPFMKSNASASSTSAATVSSLGSNPPPVMPCMKSMLFIMRSR
jgi:hypothetical protein